MSGGEGFFYGGGGRREAVDALFDGVQQADVVVLLVGAAGSGRSSLLAEFHEEADPQVLAVAIVTGDILMSPDQLLGGFADALGATGGEDPRDALWQALAACRAEERNVVLVVDDAHELGAESRAAIVAFARTADVALVLAGDESLAPAMDPEVSFKLIALQPLSEEECEEFVAGWLAVDDEDELPSHRTMARLYRHSAGMPGRLAGLLGSGAAERAPLLPNKVPFWHALFAGGSLVLLVVLVMYVTAEEPAAAPEQVELAVPLPHADAIPAPVAGVPAASAIGASIVPQPIDAKPFVPPVPAAAVQPASSAATGAGDATPVALPAAATPPPVATPAAPHNAPGARLSAVPSRQNASGVAVARYTADEEALLAEARSRYTVQLFASFNEQAAQQFQSRHLGTEMRRFRTLREELPWHVVVTGSFRNRDEAREAVLHLPLDLQALKPWARSLQSIQDELRRRRD